MAASIVQTKIGTHFDGGTTSGTITLDSAVTGGNAVVFCASRGTQVSEVITVSDAVNGTYDNIAYANAGAGQIRSKRNLTGGFTDVSFTVSGVGMEMNVTVYEVSGLDNAAAALTGTNDNSGATTHFSASSGISGTGFGATAGQIDNTAAATGTVTATGSWTLDNATEDDGRIPINMSAVATFNGDRGSFTSANAVNSNMCMAIYPEAVAAGSGRTRHRRQRLMGYGS